MIDIRALATVSASTTLVDVREALAGAHRVASIAIDARDALGEHPVWYAAGRQIVWVDITGRRVHGWNPESDEHWTVRASSDVSLAWPTAGGGVLLATAAGIVVHSRWGARDTGNTTGCGRDTRGEGAVSEAVSSAARRASGSAAHSRPAGMPAAHRFNDGACDTRGRLWISTLSPAPAANPGILFRVTPAASNTEELEFRPVLGGVHCGNGIGWSPDGAICYLVESISRTVFRFDFDPMTGALSNGEPFITLTTAGMLPDGLAVDARGDLWIAVWEGGCLLRFSSDGAPRGAWSLPTSRVTCPGFGAPGSNRLFVTSARPDAGYDISHSASPTQMRDDGRAHTNGIDSRDCAGALFSFDAGLDGLPVTAFHEGDTP
jgi:sugar lactone lactonase YvrE